MHVRKVNEYLLMYEKVEEVNGAGFFSQQIFWHEQKHEIVVVS